MHLFDPLEIRGVRFRNRIAVSPMCQYASEDGFATDWHLVHLGSRAVGGAGLVIAEATAVEPRGRISPGDLGLWKDEQIPGLACVADFIRSVGSVPGIQLAHAGRKASSARPGEGGKLLYPAQGGWEPVAPSALPFDERDPAPMALTQFDIAGIVNAFADAARRALQAGFQVVEIHGAHGYLCHEFLSPLSNRRTDEYGGPFENRIRFLLEVTRAVRAEWPQHLPVFLRISATDWADGGWTPDDSVALAYEVGALGVDLIDCSSGGLVPWAKIQPAPGYQVPFAEKIRKESGMMTGAVGLITEPAQADAIVRQGRADLVFLARELLRDPYWPLHAAKALGQNVDVTVRYGRAWA